jgi:hypothetical protein
MARNLGPMFDESIRLEHRLQAWRERIEMRRAALYVGLAAHIRESAAMREAGIDVGASPVIELQEGLLVHEVRELEAALSKPMKIATGTNINVTVTNAGDIAQAMPKPAGGRDPNSQPIYGQ